MVSVISCRAQSERAAQLHAFISHKHANFTLDASLRVVANVGKHGTESFKLLAKRVRRALLNEGVSIGHETSLQATARLQGYTDYFHVPKEPNALEVLVHGIEFHSRPVADWSNCTSLLVEACEGWLGANPSSRMLRLDVSPNSLCIYGVLPDAFEGRRSDDPIAIVRPLVAGTWLEGAARALETLRRRVEESQRATLDGLALVRFCSTRDKSAVPYSVWAGAQPADTPYSELVLMRQDYELDDGYEIARGDEVACWVQLLDALGGAEATSITIDELGAWTNGGARYAWEVATLRPHDIVPGLIRSNLPADESRHLLRRLQTAVRSGSISPYRDRGAKQIAGISALPATCKLDAHRVLHLLSERGETWEAFCEANHAHAQLPSDPVDLGFFLALATHLEHHDPSALLLRPTRGELTEIRDDHLLRALMPRVDHVRYRASAKLDAAQRDSVRNAIEDFAASLALRNGIIQMNPVLPDAVYASDGEELRNALEQAGLVMFVGLMPYLKFIPDDIRKEFPNLSAYALGTSMFIDIDLA